MAVKDWLPVAQDIYDALVADGNPKQDYKLKISHEDLCKIIDKHSIRITKQMDERYSESETVLEHTIRITVEYSNLSKSLWDNEYGEEAHVFASVINAAEERIVYASHNIPKTGWMYQIAHKLQAAFKNPKAKEEAVVDDQKEAIESAYEDVEKLVDSTKHDKRIKICSEIIEIRRKLGAVSISDLSKIIGKEFFSNDTSLFTVPGDKRCIKVLEILNNISSIVNSLSIEFELEHWVECTKDQFDKLDEIVESFKDSNKEDNNKFSLVLEYLDSIKSDRQLKKLGIFGAINASDLLKAFVVGEIVANESESVFLLDNLSSRLMMQLCDLINAPNFDIKDEVQVDTGKSLISAIKQAVLRNKALNKFGGFIGAGNSFPPPPPSMPGIDPKIYQKAAAFDRLVGALRPIFMELESQKPLVQGFDSPLNGWGNPFNI